ncbi:MAG: putative oxidoreductase, oxygen dependent, FAD-dependent protein [Ktedonobacterales bacterium]|jgi:FAD/FMN-containing dehydrogenase|nr:MAG: putative oxidoreductase, oxygen dependent, FAD-dependent protein [Ktedonobacterales bacterium]
MELHSETPDASATINQSTITGLDARLSGRVIRPSDTDYDQARAVWNGLIDRRPALIVRCQDTSDVVVAVTYAREQRLPIAVRGGSHNVAGHATCDDGLVIDLSPMKRITVSPDARLARAEGGVTWGELDAATQAHGLATPGGVYSRTGIAGLTLGGGFGWLRNTYGLACDNLVAAQVVTADGRVIRASETENRDLLWGLRGGGGNFGVVTEFEYRLRPVGPEVMFAFVFHDGSGEHMARAIRFYRDFCATAPNAINSIAVCGIIPPQDEIYPAAIHHRPFVLFGALYAGPVAEGQRALRPLIDFGTPLLDFSGVKPYVEAQQLFDADFPDGLRYYWKSLNLTRLDDAVINRLVEHARQQPSVLSTTDLWHIGGAVRRPSADEAAFHGRDAAFLLNPEANWEDPRDDAANIRWVRQFVEDMREFSDGSRYLNFAGFQEEGNQMMRGAFGPQYARLVALKNTYDPTNLFHLNQNIPPANPGAIDTAI